MVNAAAVIVPALVDLVSGILYVWIAQLVLKREVTTGSRRANTAFAIWWLALGVCTLLVPFFTIPTRLFGYRDLAMAVTLLNLILGLIVLAVWGLVYYLAFLYTGTSRAFWPITIFYVGLGFAIFYLIAYLQPTGFDADGMLTYAREQLSGGPAIALGLAFSLPVVVAALAYGSLFFRIREPGPRYRVAMVAGAFLLQFGWSAISSALELSRKYPNSVTLALLGNGLGLLSAVAILLAFRPPRGLRRRLGLAAA